MSTGPELFFRYAQPPNQLGYCGPDDPERVASLSAGDSLLQTEIAMLAEAFSGAWPYLSLLSETWGVSPLDRRVVESYWLGPPSHAGRDINSWGNSVRDRFAARAATRWERVADAVNGGGEPSHAFHVFCVYPWVGLLREGHVEPSLEVLDQCRVSMAVVEAVDAGTVYLRRSPLEWREQRLVDSSPQIVTAAPPLGLGVAAGDRVAMHWGHICQVLDDELSQRLKATEARHLRLANVELTAGRVELAG